MLKEKKPISRRKLQEMMELSGSSITSLLNGLEKRKFITRSVDDNDGRAMSIKITSAGNSLIKDMKEVFIDTNKNLLKDMTKDEKKMLYDLLGKAYRNVFQEMK